MDTSEACVGSAVCVVQQDFVRSNQADGNFKHHAQKSKCLIGIVGQTLNGKERCWVKEATLITEEIGQWIDEVLAGYGAEHGYKDWEESVAEKSMEEASVAKESVEEASVEQDSKEEESMEADSMEESK